VFISYAHADNDPLYPGSKGWATQLHEDLPLRLRANLGRAPDLSVFIDDKVRGNDEIDENLLRKVRRSAVLIVVLTQEYLDSRWCLKELETFASERHPRFDLKVGDKYRMFKVMPRDVPRERHPVPLDNANGYKFFAVDSAGPFRRTEETDTDHRHWEKLEDLAQDVADVLRTMKQLATAPAAPLPDPVRGRPAVFVAEVTDDLEEEHDQLVRELDQRGIVVVPRRELPRSIADFEAAVGDDLASATLSIHMLGRFYGKKLEGDPRSRAHAQVDLAIRHRGVRPVPQIVWIPPDVDPAQLADGPQRALLERLEAEPDARARAEVLRVGLEELKQIVSRRVLPTRPPRELQPLVYVTCVADDRNEALNLKELLKRKDYGVVLLLHNVDERAWQQTHERYLRICDVFLIVYGRAPSTWVQERALEALEQARLAPGRSRPLVASVIYEGPPPDKDDIGVDTEDIVIVNCRAGFLELTFAAVLQSLSERRQTPA
jgi:hypothetical protein